MKPDLDLPDLLTCTLQGTWRIAGTRVSLDSVIHSFWEGATPEEICQDFPSLSLAQVYGAIAYYLKQRDKVDAYLQAGRDGAEKLEQELNGRHREFLSRLRQQLLSSRQSSTPSWAGSSIFSTKTSTGESCAECAEEYLTSIPGLYRKQISFRLPTLPSLLGQPPRAGL
jgi:uncharacterized protein (DUF433 family)